MKNIILPALIMCFSLSIAYSQENTSNKTLVSKSIHSVSVNAADVLYRYEHAVAKKQTVFGEIGMGSNIAFQQDATGTYRWGMALYPAIGIGYRNYYNIEKRINSGKKTEFNSANYFGANVTANPIENIYTSKYYDASKQPTFTASLVWGLRRQLGKHFSFDFNAGPKVTDVSFKDDVDLGFIHAEWRFSYNF